MKKEKSVWAITLIAFWWLAPNQTNAQQKDSLKLINLNEVVVTATKFPKNQSETGKVLTVIDEEQLAVSGGKDLSQLLNEQVGLVINGANGNPGKDKSVFLRGARGDYTLILLDGIPITDPSGGGGAFDLRMLPIDQIDRIEILKGSQSVLYGSDAIAGVINIITKKKGSKPVGGFGTISYGTYNTFKGNAGVSGVTNLLDYNVGYTHFRTDGISEAKDATGNENFDKDGYEQDAVQVNLGIRPTEKLSINPFVRYSSFNGKYDGGSFKDDTLAKYDSKLVNFGVNSQLNFSKGAVNFLYGHDKVSRTFLSSNSFDPKGYSESSFSGNFNHAEIFTNYDITNYFQILGGLNYQWMDMDNPKGIIKNPSGDIVSPYLSFFIKNIKGLSVEVGGRYVDYESDSASKNTFTYSINPSYLIKSQVKVFANYSTGFKTPTLSQLYGQYGANPELQPEESRSLEGGLQFFSVNKKLDIRAVVFSRKLNNAIDYRGGFINLNKQDDYGFEIEPNFTVSNKLSFRVFYAFVDGEVTTKQGDRDTTYYNLIRRPKHSFGVNVAYHIGERLFVNVNIKTFGKRNDIFFDMSTYESKAVELSSYQLVNLYAEYRFFKNKLKVFADIKNLLNQQYVEVQGYNTQRLNVNTGVSFNL
jgi:vitamin B12 transporter